MPCIATGYREVAVVQLVNHQVGRVFHHRVLVAAPIVGKRLLHVDDGPTLPVHANSLCKHASALATPHIEGIEAPHQVALHRGLPQPVLVQPHPGRLDGLAARALLVDAHHHPPGRLGGKEGERRLVRRVLHFVEVEVLSIRSLRQQKHHSHSNHPFLHTVVLVFGYFAAKIQKSWQLRTAHCQLFALPAVQTLHKRFLLYPFVQFVITAVVLSPSCFIFLGFSPLTFVLMSMMPSQPSIRTSSLFT